MPSGRVFRFAWWNAQSFAHYEPDRNARDQWPSCAEQFEAKTVAINRAMKRVQRLAGPIHLVGLAEVTHKAAQRLQRLLIPNGKVFSLDLFEEPQLQVALLFTPEFPLHEVEPIVCSAVPLGTRPMAALDLLSRGHRIRFIACHWAARFREGSERTRTLLAQYLSEYIFDFMHHPKGNETNHVVVIGDFNNEPYCEVENFLHGNRSRARARQEEHYQDAACLRQRLYNCGWRFVGERVPHAGPRTRGGDGVSGTYYWREGKSWHTFDQVLVSGTLLGTRPPYLDEAKTAVIADRALLAEDGLPLAFQWSGTEVCGLSDHLPIVGQVILGGKGRR